jgi:hypothetical protein
MPARRQTTRSGSKVLAESAATRGGAVQALKHRTWAPDSDTNAEDRAAPRTDPRLRRSSSFAAPLRESFFDLAQRYHRLREAAFHKPKSSSSKSLPPPIPIVRERRLTDLPPPPSEESVSEAIYADRHVGEPPDEETLVQPLARRPSDNTPPPASERRRFATVRPPPPPDPLPRIMPSTAPLALATLPPPPAAPPPSVWRPMLATAALSATIGAIVSVGLWAVRSQPPVPKAAAAFTSTSLTSTPTTTSTIGPCPIPGAFTSASMPLSTSTPAVVTPAHTSSPVPHEVALEALPVETTSPRGAATSAPVLRAPATAPVMRAAATPAQRIPHIDLTQPKRAAVTEPPRAAATETERPSKHSHKAAADAATADAAPAVPAPLPPPPVPTAGPDRAAIARAVGRAATAASSCDGGPQSGRAQITFAPSGNVQSVQLLDPFSDNAVNGCVLRALGRAHVPPFAGDPVIVRKALSW